MKKTYCGANCEECTFSGRCKGCVESGGAPFGTKCFLADCCLSKKQENCALCNGNCELKNQLIKEIDALKIKELPDHVKELFALPGQYVNLEYPLANGVKVKLLDDRKLYFGAQFEREGNDRCIGLVADENFILVCEYGENGTDPEIVSYTRR